MVQTGMPQQQSMPVYNGTMQPMDTRTGISMQIMGLPPMGGVPIGMAPQGMMPQQQGMQAAGGIMSPGGMIGDTPPGSMMVGAPTQRTVGHDASHDRADWHATDEHGAADTRHGHAADGRELTGTGAATDEHGADDGYDDATGHDATGEHGNADAGHGHVADRHKHAVTGAATDEHDAADWHGGPDGHDTARDHATGTCGEHASAAATWT
jgi:hypothetical protein